MPNFEEYKLFVEDAARFTDRRQAITNLYITINGAIAGAITFLVKDSGLTNWWLMLGIGAFIVAGIAICFYWQQLIDKYRRLVGLRLQVLREMEEQIPGSMRMYHREDEIYPRDAQGKLIPRQGLNISDLEVRLPQLFIIIYVVVGITLLLVAFGVIPAPIVAPPKG